MLLCMAGEAARALSSERRNSPRVEQRHREAPDDLVAEVLYGVLCMSPRPRPLHQIVAGRLLYSLMGPFDVGNGGPGGWHLLPEPELALGSGPDRMVPDVAGWRRERVPTLREDDEITTPPDWVCEVLSPSTETMDRGTKMPLYGEHGVSVAWLLDPREQQLEAFRNDRGVMRPLGSWRGLVRARVPPFEELELDLALVFGS